MSDVNEQILAQLGAYPPDVQRLAGKALELSPDHSEQAVADALKNVVREIVKAGPGTA
jgi:hypothetical protein